MSRIRLQALGRRQTPRAPRSPGSASDERYAAEVVKERRWGIGIGEAV
ncbi:hypothetical protein [Mesorhizobium argentiipisi]|uniref:Uncharacterized protein n=1 Tax=Mesorhizobium argentiipisi TaxID=3015175 RepID=A0ABU8KLP1_9HYPH